MLVFCFNTFYQSPSFINSNKGHVRFLAFCPERPFPLRRVSFTEPSRGSVLLEGTWIAVARSDIYTATCPHAQDSNVSSVRVPSRRQRGRPPVRAGGGAARPRGVGQPGGAAARRLRTVLSGRPTLFVASSVPSGGTAPAGESNST